MDASGSHQANRQYYDAFSENYEAERGKNSVKGYHDMLDELEAEFVQRYGAGKDVLEVGCGTGLVLERIARFARSSRGIDLSPGMLARARERGLDVSEASATELPFENDSFDVCCSFKVLAHIPAISTALGEMARVTRPGGFVIAEFYNPNSIRGLLKRYGPAGRIASQAKESDVFTRFDSPETVARMAPPGTRFVDSRGVRIVTPSASVMRLRPVGRLLRRAEGWLADSRLKRFGGFYIAAFRKD
ncbi:MAG TPA: class I SAM-dependent methyltransferase [Polyangiaceae bacterium]